MTMSYHEREEALAKEGRNISSLYDLLNDPVAKKYGIQVEEHEFSEKTFSYLKSMGGGVAVGSILGYFFSVLCSARAKPAPSKFLYKVFESVCTQKQFLNILFGIFFSMFNVYIQFTCSHD